MDTVLSIVNIVLLVLGAGVAALAVIAPATKSETDNKILAALRWVDEKLRAVLGLVVTSGVARKSK